jgi:hypothetical protein
VSVYLKRTETHHVASRREAVEKSPWAKFVAKAVNPNGTYSYVCFEFLGDYKTYLFLRNEEYFTL